jgi:diguanylate cyclase (GGDEF)-like protein
VEEATRHRELALLTELITAHQAILAADFHLDAVLAVVATQACRLTRADAAVVELLEGDELVYRGVAGTAERFYGLRMNADTSLSGRSVRSGEILWCQDVGSEPRIGLTVAREAGARSIVVIPISHRRRGIGALKVYAGRAHALGEQELLIAQLLAAVVGSALLREEALDRLARASTTDRLTGLPNRKAWDERASRELQRASRSGNPVSLALLDLDHFRAYNDAYGHEAGDALLKSCAARWWDRVRSVDLLARLGGEEFGLLLPNCIAPDAVVALERLRAATRDLLVTSVGIAQWDMQEPLESLMLRADAALYRAKRSGRDRIELADAPEPGAGSDLRPAPLDIE